MREERKEKEETDIEISSPLMVTPPEPFNAGPATIPDGYQSLRPNQTLSRSQSQRSQNSLSLRRSRDSHEIQIIRAPSIIRTHSVDEGTQTEFDLDDSGSQDQGLSEEEAQELGYLVDIMKYYNSRLDKPLDTENSDNTQAGPPSSIRAGPSGITQTAPKLPPKMRGSPYTSRLKSSHSTPYSTNHDPMQNHIPVRTQTIDHRPHNDYPRTIPLRKHVEFERQQSGDSSDTYAASVGSKEHSDYIRDVSYTRPLLLNKTPDQPVELKSFGHPRNKVIPNSIGHDHSRSWDASGMDSKLRYVGNGDDLSRPRDLLDGNGPRPRDHVDGDPPAPRAKLRPVDIDSNSTSNSMSDIYSTGNHINHNHIPNNHTNTLGRYNTFSTRTRGRGFAYPSPTSERVSVRQFGTLGR